MNAARVADQVSLSKERESLASNSGGDIHRTTSKLASAVLLFFSILVVLGMGELIIRVKNSSMRNYDIEMWRYAKELKVLSDDPALGHEHIPSREAVLQSITIRINEQGLRGAPVGGPSPGQRRILFLGGSITLGWGVPEEQTVTERIRKKFSDDGLSVDVLNAGIGNYNAPRYVERFLTRLTTLAPTDIVVHYFLRDAEVLDAGRSNPVLRNSQLAVTLWIASSRYVTPGKPLEQHYKDAYRPDTQGYRDMISALTRLSKYAKANNIRLYLAMTPDVHDLTHYEFAFVHDQMRKVSTDLGYRYIDLLPAMRSLTPRELWSMPGDPHPNGLGHARMAEAIYPVLKSAQ
jgi:lysophospholipase L1-like esterase